MKPPSAPPPPPPIPPKSFKYFFFLNKTNKKEGGPKYSICSPWLHSAGLSNHLHAGVSGDLSIRSTNQMGR